MKMVFIALIICSLTVTSVRAEEYRFNCDENPAVTPCGPLNSTVSMNIALTIAMEDNAQVNDSIIVYKRTKNGYNTIEKWREFGVANSPVTSAADLYDFGYMIDVTDSYPPNPGLASLDGPGLGDGWIEGCVGIGVVWCRD